MAYRWHQNRATGALCELEDEIWCLSVERLATDAYERFAWWVDEAQGSGLTGEWMRVPASGLKDTEEAAKRAAEAAYERLRAPRLELVA